MPAHARSVNIRLPLALIERLEREQPALCVHGRNFAVLQLLHQELHLDPPPLPADRRQAGAKKRGQQLAGKPALNPAGRRRGK